MPSGEAREVPEAGADQRAGVVHPGDAELAPLVLDEGVALRRAEGDREAALDRLPPSPDDAEAGCDTLAVGEGGAEKLREAVADGVAVRNTEAEGGGDTELQEDCTAEPVEKALATEVPVAAALAVNKGEGGGEKVGTPENVRGRVAPALNEGSVEAEVLALFTVSLSIADRDGSAVPKVVAVAEAVEAGENETRWEAVITAVTSSDTEPFNDGEALPVPATPATEALPPSLCDAEALPAAEKESPAPDAEGVPVSEGGREVRAETEPSKKEAEGDPRKDSEAAKEALRGAEGESEEESNGVVDGASVTERSPEGLPVTLAEPLSFKECVRVVDSENAALADETAAEVRVGGDDAVALTVAETAPLPVKKALPAAESEGKTLSLAAKVARGVVDAHALSLRGADAAADIDEEDDTEDRGVPCAL